MKNFKKRYENAQSKANQFMINGQISAYIETLREMNKYKKMMLAITAN